MLNISRYIYKRAGRKKGQRSCGGWGSCIPEALPEQRNEMSIRPFTFIHSRQNGTDLVGTRCLIWQSGVVGPDKGQPPLTSPLALFSNGGERERERERAWYMHFFFALYTSTQAAKWLSFRGSCNFHSFCLCTHCICNQHEYSTYFISLQSCPE